MLNHNMAKEVHSQSLYLYRKLTSTLVEQKWKKAAGMRPFNLNKEKNLLAEHANLFVTDSFVVTFGQCKLDMLH